MSKPVTSTRRRQERLQLLRVCSGQPSVENGTRAPTRTRCRARRRRASARRRSRRPRPWRAPRPRCARRRCLPLVVVPRRDLVAPPELARDAPVLDVVHPLVVGVDPVARARSCTAPVCDRLDRLLRRSTRAVARRAWSSPRTTGRSASARRPAPVRSQRGTISLCGFVSTSRPCASRSATHRLARVEAVEAAVLRRRVVVDLRVEREDRDQRQLVALADRVVVEVVRRRDLHARRCRTRGRRSRRR